MINWYVTLLGSVIVYAIAAATGHAIAEEIDGRHDQQID